MNFEQWRQQWGPRPTQQPAEQHGEIMALNVATGKLRWKKNLSDALSEVIVAPNGNFLASRASFANRTFLFRASDGELLQTLENSYGAKRQHKSPWRIHQVFARWQNSRHQQRPKYLSLEPQRRKSTLKTCCKYLQRPTTQKRGSNSHSSRVLFVEISTESCPRPPSHSSLRQSKSSCPSHDCADTNRRTEERSSSISRARCRSI